MYECMSVPLKAARSRHERVALGGWKDGKSAETYRGVSVSVSVSLSVSVSVSE